MRNNCSSELIYGNIEFGYCSPYNKTSAVIFTLIHATCAKLEILFSQETRKADHKPFAEIGKSLLFVVLKAVWFQLNGTPDE